MGFSETISLAGSNVEWTLQSEGGDPQNTQRVARTLARVRVLRILLE